jgi:hypothetical protein
MTDELRLKASTEGSERGLEQTYVLLAKEIPLLAKDVQNAADWLLARGTADPSRPRSGWVRWMLRSTFREWWKHPLPFYSQPRSDWFIRTLTTGMRAEDWNNGACRVAIHPHREEASAVELRRRLQLTDGEILGLQKLHAMKTDHMRRLSPARVFGLLLATSVILVNQIPKEVFAGDDYAEFASAMLGISVIAFGYLVVVFGLTWFSMWRGKSRFQAVGRAIGYMEADRLRRTGKIE